MIATRLLMLLPVLCGAATSPQAEREIRPTSARDLGETIAQLELSLSLVSSELNQLKESRTKTSVPKSTLPIKQSARTRRSLESGGSRATRYKSANLRQQQAFDESSAGPGACGRDCLDGSPGLDGAPGLDGVPGVDGRNGRDGMDGKDGRDGKDGPQGPAGPPGPAGPQGEPGRRGRPGPAGRAGPPGQPGVCAYQAKYECSSAPGAGNSSSPRLLMAPTMVGQQQQQTLQSEVGANDERQVSVNEGDNIQLSCEAFGSPRPIYVWSRSDKRLPIILDAEADLKVTSYSGGQMPLARVDRSQAGSYECLASNGVPPSASKRISLDINYAPTVRLWPARQITAPAAPSRSALIECLVDSNPAALVYWMFENELIMSIGSGVGSSSSKSGSASSKSSALDDSETNIEKPSAAGGGSPKLRADGRLKRFVITESTGQLLTGASYSYLTLNITRLEPADWGQYKCVAKNLIGQTMGAISLSGPGEAAGGAVSKQQDELIANGGVGERPTEEQLDYTAGWPAQLIERNGSTARYVTFGNQHRRRTGALPADPFRGVSTSTLAAHNGGSPMMSKDADDDKQTLPALQAATGESTKSPAHQRRPTDDKAPVQVGGSSAPDTEWPPVDDDEAEACAILSEPSVDQRAPARKDPASVLLLDQIGKPVFVANGLEWARGPVSWWSMDSGSPERKQPSLGATNQSLDERHFMSTSSKADRLFCFDTLADLQRDLQAKVGSLESSSSSSSDESTGNADANVRSLHLKYPVSLAGAQLVHEGHFYYITHRSNIFRSPPANASLIVGQQVAPANSLDELSVVVVDLREASNRIRLLPIESSLFLATPSTRRKSRDELKWQPLDLGPEYKLNRVELVADENGVWLLVPTLEYVSALAQPDEGESGANSQGALVKKEKDTNEAADGEVSSWTRHGDHESAKKSHDRSSARRPRRPLRRLHALKLALANNSQRQQPARRRMGEEQATMANSLSPSVSAAGENNANMVQEAAQMALAVDHHVSMKLDWRMIGQMFLIDGLLYGIKDKHAYSSKLQFAYDLYRCKLLAGDYLAEPHRTFTNHFGNTQLIKYNPNEPKRLFTMDSGNLLWRPVKLMAKSAGAALDEF